MSKPIDRSAMQVASRAAGEAFVAVIESMGVQMSNELASRVWRHCTESSLWIVRVSIPVPRSISMPSTRKQANSSCTSSNMRRT